MSWFKLWLGCALVTISASSHAANFLENTLQLCANCHGERGISSIPIYPNLAGQKSLYLKQQLIHFREGQRASAVMGPMSKSLSDQDIELLADYYSRIGVDGKEPQ